MKTSLIKLSILLLFCGTANAQWVITDEDVHSKNFDELTFRISVTEDSIINTAVGIYVRPGYWLSPTHCKINRNGVITDSVSLYGTGVAQIPTSIDWTNDGHYLVGRDTTSFWDGSGAWYSRRFEYRSISNHNTKWFISGAFERTSFMGTFINKNNEFWMQQPFYNSELYALSAVDGDTNMTIGSQEINHRWQPGAGYELIGTLMYGPTWRRSDTCIMRAEFIRGPIGSTEFKTLFALVSLDSLKVLSPTRVWADWARGGYDRFNFDKFTHVKDSVIFKPGNKLDRVLYEEDMITGAITKTLRIKDLEYDPDTARFRPNHFYQVYNRGAFCLYIEEFEAEYPIANSVLSGRSSKILRVRLYQDSTLLYSKEIADTSDGGYHDTKLADAYLFPDGEALINMRVRWATSRLLYIDAQGNHWLKEEQVDLSKPVSVYPTLVEDQIFISCPAKKLKVQLYSLGGSLVHEQSLESFNETFQIGSLKLESGIYILKGSYQNGAFTRKVIVR